VIIKKDSLLQQIVRLTHNVEDAEDAIQGAYVYQLAHGLKKKHFMWKAFNLAKNNHRDRKSKFLLWEFGGLESDSEVLDSQSMPQGECQSGFAAIEAKDEYKQIYVRLSVKNQRLFAILLEYGGACTEASEATGINKASFKQLMCLIRQGKTGCKKTTILNCQS